MQEPAYVNIIETGVPPYDVQALLQDFIPQFTASPEEREKLVQISRKTEIEHRYSVLKKLFDRDGSPHESKDAFYHGDFSTSTAKRMELYKQEALPLISPVLENIFQKVLPDQITHLIITSCTGFYAPGLDVDIIQKFDLDPTMERSFLGYMGCYAAIPALKLAHHIVLSREKACVLTVNLELCSLHWKRKASFDQQVSFLLFGDGCAASLISRRPEGLRIDDFYSQIIPETRHLMGWTIGDEGFFMNLDSRVSKCLLETLKQEESTILKKPPKDYSLWAIHPGGRSILDAAQEALALPDAAMVPSRKILRNFGNMSSPTVMFVLKEFLDDIGQKGNGCAMAFGPGLTLESMTFRKGLP